MVGFVGLPCCFGVDDVHGSLVVARKQEGMYRRRRRTVAMSMDSPGPERSARGGSQGVLPGWVFVRTALRRSELDDEIARLCIPALGAMAMDPVLSLVDTAFVGRLGGAEPLAGVGVSSVVFNLSFALFNFLGIALTPLVAAANARGDEQEAARSIATALFVAVSIGTLLMAFLIVQAPAIVTLMGASNSVVPHAVGYLRARAIASPFVLVCVATTGAYRGFQDTRTTFVVALVTNLINLVLDPIFIFRYGMGAAGAALATAVSQIVAAFGLVYRLLQTRRLSFRELLRVPSIADVLPLARAGAAITIRTTSVLTTVALASHSASRLGAIVTASFEITRQCWVTCTMMLDSLAATAQSMTAFALGTSNVERARAASYRVLQIASMAGGTLGIMLLAGTWNGLASVFTLDAAVKSMASASLPLVAAIQPLNALVMVLEGSLMGARDFQHVSFTMFLAACVASATLLMIRPLGLGLVGVWLGLNALTVARAVLLARRYHSRTGPLAEATGR